MKRRISTSTHSKVPARTAGTARLARLTGAATALGAGVALGLRARSVAAVPRELRRPSLWLPVSLGSRVELALGRTWIGSSATPTVNGVAVSEIEVPGGHRALAYQPQSRVNPSGALLWIHGGGLVLGRPEVDNELCSQLAHELGVVVISAGYRLAPEHPFPAAVDDCTAALKFLHAQATSLGVDPARVAVGGASAGGGLAASVAQRASDEGVTVCLQVLLYPMLDVRTATVRQHQGRGRVAWTPRSNRWAWRAYLGHNVRQDERRPYAVPAARHDLSGLPPAWIGVGDLDLFFTEDVVYAQRLRAAGVPVELHVEPGMYHGAEVALHTIVPSMAAFRRQIFDALAQALCAAESADGPTSS